MSGGTYVLGVVVVAAIVAPVCLAGRALRIRFLPDWSGARAVLATSVIAIALLETAAQLVGTFGLLTRVPLIVVLLTSCAAIVVLTSRDRPGAARRPHLDERAVAAELSHPRRSTVLTVIVVGTAFLPWLARTIGSLRTGVLGYDSLDYHLPFAARFFQTGRVTSLYYTFPPIATAFYPVNDELVHAIGMLATRRDVLTPFINLAWLALALLAAWCTQAQRRMRPLAVAGIGMLVATPLFTAFAGGRATNDLSALALFVASVALLLNSDGRRAALSVSAVAAGLAIATKLTMVVPVVALTVGVIVLAVAGTRVRTAATWLPWILLTGSYWYVRNLVAIGNPVPTLQAGLGPVSLPSPTVSGSYRLFSVAHYLPDVGIWRSWFLPGLRDAFGLAWPLLLGLAAAGWVLAVIRGNRMERMLGIVALVAFAGYVVTPASAGGASGRPVLFASDTRFAFPALALGLVLLPRVIPKTVVARRWLLALIGLGLLSDAVYALKDASGVSVAAILVEAFVLVTVAGALWVWATRTRRAWLAFASVAVLGVLAIGWAAQHSYLDRRYSNAARNPPYGSAPQPELVAIEKWVRHVSDKRIALNGLGISYPLFGRDLSNTVDYVARRGPHGDFDEATTCREWRQLLNNGNYDYVVISPDSRDDPEPPTAAWTRSDPAAVPVLHEGKASVFRVQDRFDPTKCAD